MKQLQRSLIGIISTLLLTWTQLSYAQAEDMDATSPLRFTSPTDRDIFIATADFDDDADQTTLAGGAFVSTPLGRGYKVFYKAGGELDRRLDPLADRERRDVLEREFTPLIRHLDKNQIQPVMLEGTGAGRPRFKADLPEKFVEAAHRIKAKKRGNVITVDKKRRTGGIVRD